jgi:hypothetical protein
LIYCFILADFIDASFPSLEYILVLYHLIHAVKLFDCFTQATR